MKKGHERETARSYPTLWHPPEEISSRAPARVGVAYNSLRRSTPTRPRIPVPNSRMLLISGVPVVSVS
jgi:hypothetical protein